jgi:hypothetical protein
MSEGDHRAESLRAMTKSPSSRQVPHFSRLPNYRARPPHRKKSFSVSAFAPRKATMWQLIALATPPTLTGSSARPAGAAWVVGGGISLVRLRELTGIDLATDLPPDGPVT